MEEEAVVGGMGIPLFSCQLSSALDQMDAFHGEEQISYKAMTHKAEISHVHSLIISTYLFLSFHLQFNFSV